MSKKDKLRKMSMELLGEENGLSLSYFASKFHVSLKTIYNYMNELAYELQSFNLSIQKHKNGIVLIGNENDKERYRYHIFHNVQGESSETRRDELIESLLMFDEKVSVRKLEIKYNVAKSSIINDLEYVDKILQKSNLFLMKDKTGTYIGGKEQHIRSAKRKYVFEQFQLQISAKESYDLNSCSKILEKYVNDNNMRIAEEMIDYLSEILNWKINDVYFNQIFIQFAIFLNRIENQHLLVTTTYRPVVSELHKLKTYPATLELSRWLAAERNIKLKDQDIRWLNARISGAYHENTINLSNNKSAEITKVLYEFIEIISSVIGENLSDDKVLVSGLEQHLIPMFTRMTNKIKITNPFLNQIKNQYPALFSALLLAASTFENSFGMSVSDDEISFILIHFQAAIERRNLSKKIAIVLNGKGASADLIENRVKRNLPQFDVVETFNLEDYSISFLDEFDFIISTISISYDKKPVLLISPLVDEIDIKNIRKIYSKLDYQKPNNQNNFLIDILDDKFIYLNEKLKNKEQVLNWVSQILANHNFVVDGFLDSMVARENIYPTEMGNGIAIPHGSPQFVNQNKIILITLEKPILWEHNKVDVIFCLAMDITEKEQSRKMISNVYHIIKETDVVRKIRNSRTKNELLNEIKNAYSVK